MAEACGDSRRPDSVALDPALIEETDKRTADLIAEVAKNGAAAGDKSRKIADLYNSYHG